MIRAGVMLKRFGPDIRWNVCGEPHDLKVGNIRKADYQIHSGSCAV